MNPAKSFVIGLFVITALVIAFYMITFIHPSVGNEGHELKVRFANIDKITVGTRVSFAGKPVGVVRSIKEIQDVIDRRVSINGAVYAYELILAVDSSVNVYNTDRISKHVSDLLGETSINIALGSPNPGEELVLMNDKIIYAKESKSFDDIIQIAADAFNDVQNKHIIDIVSDAFSNIRDIATSLNQPEELRQIIDNLSDLFDRIVKSWDTVDVSLNNLAKTTDDTKIIAAKLSSGEGSAGQIVMRDDFYTNLNGIMHKGDDILDDINNYGLLFHLNKKWQRLHARRLNLVCKLETPEEFYEYFREELDEISDSLARVSISMGFADDPMCIYELIEEKDFRRYLADLVNRVSMLNNEFKSYNIQFYDHCRECNDTCQ